MIDYQIDARGIKTSWLRSCWWCILILLSGCASWQDIARRDHLQQSVVAGETFSHRLLWNAVAEQRLHDPGSTRTTWHVYIEGDGHAVTLFGKPSADPTPYAPILLPALAKDAAPAVYLGRPCYFDTLLEPCSPAQWTLNRYSLATVSSMLQALQQIIPAQDNLILIGHSGGGALATLLAARLPQTCAVITLAGNLDVDAWVSTHHYTPMPESLNPTSQPPLAAAIRQWHFAGAQDTVILPQWIQAFSAKQPNATYRELPNTDHITPWQKYLVESLKALQNQAALPTEAGTAPLRDALDNSQSVCGKVTG